MKGLLPYDIQQPEFLQSRYSYASFHRAEYARGGRVLMPR